MKETMHRVPTLQRGRRRLAGLLVAPLLVVSGGVTSLGGIVHASKPAIQNGGTVTMPIVGDPTFNPWFPGVGIESVFPDRVLFDGLTKPGVGGLPQPDLATHWQASANGLTWTFNLRHGVTWQDGAPFTASDVAYTFNNIVLVKALAASGSSYFLAVSNVQAVDNYTVVFHLSRQFAALPAYLGYNAGILPKHIFNGQDPFKLTSFNKNHPVGTGPFQISSYVPDQSVTLVANPHYWAGRPHLDSLVFKVLPDPNAQIAQVLSGEINLMTVDANAAATRLKGASNLALSAQYVPQFFWIALNQSNSLFTDVKVRQAIEYALDRKAMITAVTRGYATVANSAISPALGYYYNPNINQNAFNPAKARALLAQAGWKPGSDGILTKNGQKFSFVLDAGQKGYLVPIAELVQSYLKNVGINVQLNVMEWNASIQKDFVQKSYQAVVNWWVYPDDPDVSPFFSSAAANTEENEPGY
ncbi:MAG TPA: ABC transporter substrate-binding protein, partial [Chloroflexota bacterium]|nr:ABC transporter substrate-binding protein [Chloroflexota bacterium]